MSALWGFLGTIVGAAAVFAATVWQQHVSHEHERESQRRGAQIEILNELEDVVMTYVERSGAERRQRRAAGLPGPLGGSSPTEVITALFRVRRLATRVLDDNVRMEATALWDAFVDADNATEPTDEKRKKDKALDQADKVLKLIGDKLRALY